jgi:hypothetical protein
LTSVNGKPIRITSRGKSKLVHVPNDTHIVIAVLKVFFPPNTPVKLGAYTFSIKEIEPWPPAPPPEQVKMF